MKFHTIYGEGGSFSRLWDALTDQSAETRSPRWGAPAADEATVSSHPNKKSPVFLVMARSKARQSKEIECCPRLHGLADSDQRLSPRQLRQRADAGHPHAAAGLATKTGSRR